MNLTTEIRHYGLTAQLARLAVMLAMALAFIPQTAEACKLEDTWRYTVMLEGTDKLRLKMPLYDKEDYDCWIVDGTVYIQVDGSSEKETLFYYESQTNIDRSDYLPRIYCRRGVDGTMTLFRDRGYSAVSVGTTKGNDLCPCVDNQDYTIVNLLWDIPNKYRGKTVTISWTIHHTGNGTEYNKYISIDASRISIPAAPQLQKPMVMDPIISFESGQVNQMLVPYMITASNISKATAFYDEVSGSTRTAKTLTLGTASSDFVRLPIDRTVENFYIETTYTDNEDKVQTTQSAPISLPVLHHPKSLSAMVQTDGSVTLRWTVENPSWKDLQPSDTWEIQRNVAGENSPSEGQWTSLGQLSFSEKLSEYTYTDNTLLMAYQNQPVYYRVRRVITAAWNWEPSSGYAITKLPPTLALPAVSKATVQRNGTWTDESHTVKVNFQMGAAQEKDSQGRLILQTADDWKAFAQRVSNGETSINAVMCADIDLKDDLVPVGTQAKPYSGTFDGNGHTLAFNDTLNVQNAAPFGYAKNATIRNLRTVGAVCSSQKFASGLVAHVPESCRLTIENCRVSVNVGSTVKGDATNGGLVAVAEVMTRIAINNCLFDGKMTGTSCNSCGGFVGFSWAWVNVTNSLFAPTELKTGTNDCRTFARMSNTPTLTVSNCFNTMIYNPSEETGSDTKTGTSVGDMMPLELKNKLGDQWELLANQVVPVMTTSNDDAHKTLIWDNRAKLVLNIDKLSGDIVKYTERREITDAEREAGEAVVALTTSCVDHTFRFTIEQGASTLPLSYKKDIPVAKTDETELQNYRFDNNGAVTALHLDSLQTSVNLSWETDGGFIDFYRILRYDKLTPELVDTLESAYTQTAYMDRNVRPQHNYVYTVQGITVCEGEHVTQVSREGGCIPTGTIRGYVRLSSGIGIPGILVTATPDKTITGAAIGTCETDSTGYFEISALKYSLSGKYTLTAAGLSESKTVVFDEDCNLFTNVIFYENSYFTMRGFVLYEGSSIPVAGVQFLRDGIPVMNAAGQPVTTNNQGAFELSIPEGAHSIQVAKDGHIFADEGYFIDLDKQQNDKHEYNWDKDISDVYFWDQTKVTLQGRVVGGNVQGEKPLGQSLSKNNLGNDITIVMQLEGDNTSWIVRDQMDQTVTESHFSVAHGAQDKDTTTVDAYRHRIVIHPDLKTGEYQVPFYPVKFKVTEIYAEGYPTLFQSGTVSETLDLTKYQQGDTATYSRIYHNTPTLDIWQFNGTQDRFYGVRQYTALDNAGLRDTVTIWKDGEYAFGHPVFMAGSPVPMTLSAREEYYFNNEKLGELDIVQLDGGTVLAANQLVATDQSDEIELDSLGQAVYTFTPQNTTFNLEGDMALRTLKFTLMYDSTYYDIQPIKGYVMAVMPKPQGRRILAGTNAHLLDILRDPPGTNSSAYIEKGTRYNYNYSADLSINMGVNINVQMGSGTDYYVGSWAGTGSGGAAGAINSHDDHLSLDYKLGTTYYRDWEYNYEFTTTERIQTSEENRFGIGKDADVYLGVVENVIVEDAIAVRAVSQATLNRLLPRMGNTTEVNGREFQVLGTAKIIASGWDAQKEDSVFLVRDEVMQFYNKLSSSFTYSQGYLTNDLIPGLIRTRNSLILGQETEPSYAQSMADNMKRPVYVSKVDTDDEKFATSGNYVMYIPKGMNDQWSDSIMALNSQILTWAGFIAANEKEKLEATDLVKVFDFNGGAQLEYSENFTASSGLHRYWQLPSAFELGGDGIGTDNSGGETHTDNDEQKVEFKAGGVFFSLNVAPLFGFDFNYNNGMEEEYSKEAGFTMACQLQSNLSVAVYRTKELSNDSIQSLINNGDVYYKFSEQALKDIYNGRPGSSNTTSYIENPTNVKRYRNFVFRTLGGATASPWEDERRTEFYNPGTLLDAKTEQINQLRVWAKEPSVSNVPYGEPAVFTIFLTNESNFPERITRSLSFYSEDTSNPKGAKIYMGGAPITGAGIDMWIDPGTIIEKQVEIYAGTEYEYDDLMLTLMDPDDVDHPATVSLSAHFVPSAGKINISKPGDKWVVNTESAFDEKKKLYYLPVHIDGFNVNYRNFDHIELQYKLTNQGDKDWVNVCSYYHDSEEGRQLMDLASGERKLMENDGFIDANFYGETDPVEQNYDIRAVVFCRYGNGYLTSSSNILTGIKDTRRPQLFGTPKPVNGILGIGDDIRISFSESIASDYLSKINNFEVLGSLNTSNVSLSTTLLFNEMSSVSSKSQRNLTNKDFTIDIMLNPQTTGNNMVVMSNGTYAHPLIIGVTADSHLAAYVEGASFKSDKAVEFSGLHHVAYVFDVDDVENITKVTFYDGNTPVGGGQFDGVFSGEGLLFFGTQLLHYGDSSNETLKSWKNYEGEMLEARIWNKAMSAGELSRYAGKSLTGYELGLIDYYPMNEGHGDLAKDKAAGSNDLTLFGTSWKVPDGIGLRLDGEKGVKLTPDCFQREDFEDYTLMFWFRTETIGNEGIATIIANGEAKDEPGAKDHFNIGMDNGMLFFRSGGQQVNVNGFYSDGSWHNMAVTVDRARNVGNIYVDQALGATFPVDTLGGILGNNLAVGATYTDAQTPTQQLKGYIDEIAMFEMALPENMIANFADRTPSGEEMGLLLYLPFSQSEKQSNNQQRLMPTGVSMKKYKDNHGNIVESRRDTIVSQDIIEQVFDRTVYAPISNTGKLENINYSYVCDGNDLVIDLDVPDYQIEKTNVYITVKEVADLRGNLMASPVVMDLYVYRNPLRWDAKRKTVETMYGKEATLTLNIENLSGKTQTYKIDGLPQWMTASLTSGSIAALDEEALTLTISPYTNVGTYQEVIYIIGENDIAEPLPITVRVKAEEPEWEVADDLKAANQTMHMVVQVVTDGQISHDPEDILSVIGNGHRVMGVGHMDNDQKSGSNDGLFYITIYNDQDTPTPLQFEFFDSSTGNIHIIKKEFIQMDDGSMDEDTIFFVADTIMGSTTNPVLLYNTWEEVQVMSLDRGWNWVSFYVEPEEATVAELLSSVCLWDVGDAIELVEHNGKRQLITYKSVYDQKTRTYHNMWDKADEKVELDPTLMYRLYSRTEKKLYMPGFESVYSPVTVRKGWNRIGYCSDVNLPLATALSDYTDAAYDGDIIKSQSEFAVMSIDASGNRMWKGTLKYMCSGEGYMLKRNAESEFTFYYPHYTGGQASDSPAKPRKSLLHRNRESGSMNIIARVTDFSLLPGDRLVAYSGAEQCGMVEQDDDELFFLSVGRSEEADIAFAIERDGEIVATSRMQMPYQENAVKGSIDQPTAITFASVDNIAGEGWYSLQGIKLDGKPSLRGVYIHNGKKVLIQ